ncbi:hypothetical protein HYY69_06430 [Candidatus Woesearchaeota archaeon]|nr:hypothetical protein [Candidatus Woesearchaeota archaeon]
MPIIDLNDYEYLDPDRDLEASLIEIKLNALVQEIPDWTKKELYPCFYQAYSLLVNAFAGGNTRQKVQYYTQTEQADQFNKLALITFNVLILYAGCLGNLIRTANKNELLPEILAVGKKVFSYSEGNSSGEQYRQ